MKIKANHIISVLFAITLFNNSLFAAQTAQNTDDKLPLEDLERFTTVIEHVKNYYVKPVEDPVLFENAIRGMLAGLDPHSAYLNKEEFAELKASTSGKFGGLGIEVTLEDGLIKVIAPIDGSPAAKAGVQPGDLIIRIDDTPVKDLKLQDAVEKMRGKPGSEVSLTLIRKSQPKPFKIKIARAIVNVQSVKTKMIEDGYAYIRIAQFQNETGTEVAQEVKNLLKKNNGKLKGIIVDLRNNPGGVLDASVQTASVFLDKDKLPYDKVVVFTKGRINGSQIKEKASGKDLTNGVPMVVLVNSGSASASEIVAGALQDYKRATILGTTTFGKGSVQTVLPLTDNRGLKLTTALYYTPAGRSIQAKGIVPDVIVDNPATTNKNSQQVTEDEMIIHEADLSGHLDNADSPKQTTTTEVPPATKTVPAAQDENVQLQNDYQLQQALKLLKNKKQTANK